jgi:HSP20 family protein
MWVTGRVRENGAAGTAMNGSAKDDNGGDVVMAITRWDPFGEMLQMQRDMDRIFSRMGTAEGGVGTTTTAWMPRINVKRVGDDLDVHVELAGIKPDDVDIEVTDGLLTIRGERNAETTKEDEGWVIRESNFRSFERSIALPEGVDPASIKADFHDGMLEVHVPKALELAKPKTTKIAIGGAAEEVAEGQEAFTDAQMAPLAEPVGEQPQPHAQH